MGQRDIILAAISRIHAAGLDSDTWPDALSHVNGLIGGNGASLEFLQLPTLRHQRIFSYALPTAEVGEYLKHYAPMCPRLPYSVGQPTGTVLYDALYATEQEMDANPFFAEFLAKLDMRYGLGGIIAKSAKELVVAGVQISPKNGHPTKPKIKLFGILLPHLQQAVDVMCRLDQAATKQVALETGLDSLLDGVLMIALDGSVRYANLAARVIFRRNDGITVEGPELRFASNEAAAKLGAALKAIRRLRESELDSPIPWDFLASRKSGAPAYSVFVRPLLAKATKLGSVAMIFIHDPMTRSATIAELLSQMFKLTAAESMVANALWLGQSPDEYAFINNVSPNTVYTHIRRLKEKTGSKRMGELIRKLNRVHVPVKDREV